MRIAPIVFGFSSVAIWWIALIPTKQNCLTNATIVITATLCNIAKVVMIAVKDISFWIAAEFRIALGA
jgi:hypothetical protein